MSERTHTAVAVIMTVIIMVMVMIAMGALMVVAVAFSMQAVAKPVQLQKTSHDISGLFLTKYRLEKSEREIRKRGLRRSEPIENSSWCTP